MAAENTEDVGGGVATEEVDEMTRPATKRDLKDAIAEVAAGFRQGTKEAVDEALSGAEAPLTYEESRKAARVGMLQAVLIIVAIVGGGFGLYKFFTSATNYAASLQDKDQYKLLTVNEPGGGLKGIFYCPPGPSYDSKTTGSGEYGVYYVQPEEQTSDAQAMGLHLITRALENWKETIIGSEDTREMVSTPQLIYDGGAPVAAFVYYRHVKKNKEGQKG